MNRLLRLMACVLVAVLPACSTLDAETPRDAAVWLSSDGEHWTRIEDSDLGGVGEQQMTGVASTETGLLAVGLVIRNGDLDGRVWRSPDGRDWRIAADLGGPGDQRIHAVASARPGVVAVGQVGDRDDLDGAIWTSEDGTRWTPAVDVPSLTGPGEQSVSAVVGFGPLVVAGGTFDDDAAVWTSTDGNVWGRVESPALGGSGRQSISALVETGGGLVALGSDEQDGAAWTSPDGLDWERVGTPGLGGDGIQTIVDVVATDRGLVAVGEDTAHEAIHFLGRGGEFTADAAVWTSDDGRAWTRVADADLGGPGNQAASTVLFWNGAFVAGGLDTVDRGPGGAQTEFGSGRDVDAAVWISRDLSTWRKVRTEALGGPNWQDVWGLAITPSGMLVAVGGDDAGGS